MRRARLGASFEAGPAVDTLRLRAAPRPPQLRRSAAWSARGPRRAGGGAKAQKTLPGARAPRGPRARLRLRAALPPAPRAPRDTPYYHARLRRVRRARRARVRRVRGAVLLARVPARGVAGAPGRVPRGGGGGGHRAGKDLCGQTHGVLAVRGAFSGRAARVHGVPHGRVLRRRVPARGVGWAQGNLPSGGRGEIRGDDGACRGGKNGRYVQRRSLLQERHGRGG